MNVTQTLLDYLRSLHDSRIMLRSPSVLVPFVLFTAIQCAVLFALTFFTVAPFSSFMIPVIESLGGEEALHYPMHFILLPGIYQQIYLPLAMLVGFVFYGWAVFLMGDYYEQHGTRMAERPPFGRAIPSLVLIGIIYVAVASFAPVLFAWLGGLVDNAKLAGLTTFAGFLVAASLQALFIYSPLFVRTKGVGAAKAIVASFHFGRKNFGATALLILTVILVHQPLEYLLRQPDAVVLKFKPELVFYLLLGGIIVELITTYFLFAATSSLVLSRREDPPF